MVVMPKEPIEPENNPIEEDAMRPEYDLRGGVRGKYYRQYMEGTNVVLLDQERRTPLRDEKT